MTAPASILALVRSHAEAALGGLVIIVIVACIWGANMAGKHTQAAIDAMATREAIDSSLASNQRKQAAALAELRDTALALTRMQAKFDSAQAKSRSESNRRETASNLQRAKTSIDSATSSVSISTDSGVVTLQVPPLVATTWSAERAADVSTIASMRSSLLADSLSMAERDLRLRNDSLQFVRRDSIDADYVARLANKNAEIAGLAKTRAPRFSAGQGVVAGVLGTLGAILGAILTFGH